MDAIITPVIVPRLEPTATECLSRGHLPALRPARRELHSFGQRDREVDTARAHRAAVVSNDVV